MTPPKLQITDSPVISDEMITFRWLYNEQASSTCTLQTPTSMAIIPCINNSVMLAYPQEGYSLYIQGTDLAGNTAEAVQLTWTVGELILPDPSSLLIKTNYILSSNNNLWHYKAQ